MDSQYLTLLGPQMDPLVYKLIEVFTPEITLYDSKLTPATKASLAKQECAQAANRLFPHDLPLKHIFQLIPVHLRSNKPRRDGIPDQMYIDAARHGCIPADIAMLIYAEFIQYGKLGKYDHWRDAVVTTAGKEMAICFKGPETDHGMKRVEHIHTFVECLLLQAMWNHPNQTLKDMETLNFEENPQFQSAVKTLEEAKWQPQAISAVVDKIVRIPDPLGVITDDYNEDADDDLESTHAALLASFRSAVLACAEARIKAQAHQFLHRFTVVHLPLVLQEMRTLLRSVPFTHAAMSLKYRCEDLGIQIEEKQRFYGSENSNNFPLEEDVERHSRAFARSCSRRRRRNQQQAFVAQEFDRFRELCHSWASNHTTERDELAQARGFVQGWLQEAKQVMDGARDQTGVLKSSSCELLNVLAQNLFSDKTLGEISVSDSQLRCWTDIAGRGSSFLLRFPGVHTRECAKRSVAEFFSLVHRQVLNDLAPYITARYCTK